MIGAPGTGREHGDWGPGRALKGRHYSRPRTDTLTQVTRMRQEIKFTPTTTAIARCDDMTHFAGSKQLKLDKHL